MNNGVEGRSYSIFFFNLLSKVYGARTLMKEFSAETTKKIMLNDILKQLKETGNCQRLLGRLFYN